MARPQPITIEPPAPDIAFLLSMLVQLPCGALAAAARDAQHEREQAEAQALASIDHEGSIRTVARGDIRTPSIIMLDEGTSPKVLVDFSPCCPLETSSPDDLRMIAMKLTAVANALALAMATANASAAVDSVTL